MFNNYITIFPPHHSSSHGLESVCALNGGCVKSARQQPPLLSFIILLSSSPTKESECTTWSQNHNSVQFNYDQSTEYECLKVAKFDCKNWKVDTFGIQTLDAYL